MDYYDAHIEGRGIWKWQHYFPIYERHFGKFVDRDVKVMEVGVYSGGSLDMWRSYFGPRCQVFGVDIEPACKQYEDDVTTILIGDQADRSFWKRVRDSVPPIDVLIDDGGHLPYQQIVTLEEMLPYMNPGGVYLCEDLYLEYNEFGAYLGGLATRQNRSTRLPGEPLTCVRSEFQSAIESIHLYPFVAVIEKASQRIEQFSAPKRGTEWQPFLD